MAAIRRTYVLLTSAFALQAAAWAAAFLLGGLVDPAADPVPTAIAFQVAVLVVTVPLFIVHWRWALRMGADDPAEATSGARCFYLYAMAGLFVLPIVINAHTLLYTLLTPVAGGGTEGLTSDLAKSVSSIFVFGAAAWIIRRQLIADREATGEPGRSSAFRRLFTFGLSAVGLVIGANGAIALLHTLMQGVVVVGIPLGARQVAEVAAAALVGGGLWATLWLYAQRRFATGEPDETDSALRKLYLHGVVLITVLAAVFNAALLLAGYLRTALGLDPRGDWRAPLAVIAVNGLLWAYHRHVLNEDVAAAGEAPRQAAMRRLYDYLVAVVGLFATLAGLVGVVDVLLRALGGAGGIGDAQREVLAWSIAGLAAGLPVWLRPWRRAQNEAVAGDAAGEAARAALPRKAYLYFTLLVAAVTLVTSAVYIIFRLISTALGEPDPESNLGLDLARAAALAAIAAATWAYHFRALRADGDLDAGARRRRLSALTVVVADSMDGGIGARLIEALAREASHVSLVPAGIGETAGARMRAAAQAAGFALPDPAPTLAESVASADVVIAPWRALTPDRPAEAAFAQAMAGGSARRLIVPTSDDQWAWIGVDAREQEAVDADVVRAVEQIAAGAPVAPVHRLNPAELVLIGVGLLVLAGIVGIPLAILLSRLL